MLECFLGVNQWFIKYFFILRTEFLIQVTQEKILVGLRKEKPWFTSICAQMPLSWENCHWRFQSCAHGSDPVISVLQVLRGGTG